MKEAIRTSRIIKCGKSLSFAISYISLLLIWKYIYENIENPSLYAFIGKSNVTIYVAGIVVFFVVYVILDKTIVGILGRLSSSKSYTGYMIKERNAFWLFGGTIALFFVSLYIHWFFVDSFYEVGRIDGTYNSMPLILQCSIAAMILTWSIIQLFKNTDIDVLGVGASYSISVICAFLQTYMPNPFSAYVNAFNPSFPNNKPFYFGLADLTSVTESIYNVLDFTPFTFKSVGMYGHYSIFFLPFLKLMGESARNVAICLAICGVLEQIAFLYVINEIAPRNWMKVLFSLGTIVRTTYYYPAIFPIRTMFPMLICALVLWLGKHGFLKNIKQTIVFLYIMGMISVVWNTESGIACVVGITAFVFTYKENLKNNFMRIVVGILVALITPIIIINVYNLLCGYRKVEIASFFYPFINTKFVNDSIRSNVMFGNHLWIFLLGFMLVCICIKLRKKCLSSNDRVTFFLACTGIAVFTYYFNEAHWGCLVICYKIVACLSVLFIREVFEVIDKDQASSFSNHSCFVLMLTIIALYSMNATNVITTDIIWISERFLDGAYDYSYLKNDAVNNIEKEIPPDTYGVGEGIQIVYHELGWNNHASYRDLSSLIEYDVQGIGQSSIINELLNNDDLLINTTGTDYFMGLLDENGYSLVKKVSVCGFEFGLFSRGNGK